MRFGVTIWVKPDPQREGSLMVLESKLLDSLLSVLLFFAEPGFPTRDIEALVQPPAGATVATSVVELRQQLTADKVLVWRHGSTFPAELWGDLTRFLEEGGSLLYLGGAPFTHAVTGQVGQRQVQDKSVNLLKALRLNQCYWLAAGGAEQHAFADNSASDRAARPKPRKLGKECRVAILEPRLSDTKDFLREDGAPGSRDALLRPLSYIHLPGSDARFPDACSSFALDRLRGRFAGGRWVFYLLTQRPTAEELHRLYAEAAQAPLDLRLDPTLGCYHPGEQPAVRVSLHRPRRSGSKRNSVAQQLTVTCKQVDGEGSWKQQVTLSATEHDSVTLSFAEAKAPGLYRVSADSPELGSFETGFWIYDSKLFASGDRLGFDSFTLTRNGIPEPVMGTTVMSRSVHRKFLFEPNAAVWDDTFSELAALDINFVRTGIWSAYRKIALDPNVIDEAWLRALEGYYLSARRHGIPILFTFFSFVPEPFGGENPYFDPRSREAQRAYVSAVVRRFTDAKEILWDLINEPSFSSPDKLWSCRPTGDPHEARAFLAWLEARYSVGDSGGTWQDEVRSRWRLRPDEGIGLPHDADFSDRHHIGDFRPYRAKEFAHFAQDAFVDWVKDMSATIRAAGSTAAISVGQDEGGLHERPHPLYHADSIDFTGMHTWWYNDALLWDGVLAKAPGKPLLVSETGIMQRELLSGESIRTPRTAAELLSRKIGFAFAGGAFGLVEWCYEVNPFMASDNEVAIGLVRTDGSYKPEHHVLREFASFVERHGPLCQGFEEPEGVLLFPSADHYSPRGLQLQGTRRIVEIFTRLGAPLQVIPEYRSATLNQRAVAPRFVVLPTTRGVSEGAWNDLESYVRSGGTLLCSGWFEQDDVGRARRRLGLQRRRIARVEEIDLSQAERGRKSDNNELLYSLEILESAFCCDRARQLELWSLGSGKVAHLSLALDWAKPCQLQEQCYRRMLQLADVVLPASRWGKTPRGVTLRALKFAQGEWIVAINEGSRHQQITLGTTQVKLAAGLTTLIAVDAEGQVQEICAPRP